LIPHLRTAGCSLALLLGAAVSVAAQDRDTTAVPGFDGGIHWGATQEQVNAFWRETPLQQARVRDATLLAYKPWQNMNWTAFVHDERGLFGLVAQSLPSLSADQCEAVFNGLVRAMKESFPGVQPDGEKQVERGDALCPAVRAGRAHAQFSWTDPATGVIAVVRVNPETGTADYAMGTRFFAGWAKPGQEAAAGPAPAAAPQAATAAAPQTDAHDLGVTERALKAIRPGMSYRQVVQIVGREGRRAEALPGASPNVATYTWSEGSRSIGASFRDDRAFMSMQTLLQPERPGPPATFANFQRLREGMTYDEVAAIMGSPGLYSGFSELMGLVSDSWIWRGAQPGSLASASFRDGRATTLQQFLLDR
jgi:hypothetical protein